MSGFKRFNKSSLQGPRLTTGRSLGLTAVSLVVLALLVVACGPAAEPTALPPAMPTVTPGPTDTPAAEAMITPSVTVSDQEIADGQVTITKVVSDGPGWLVIHAQADGKPGPILGYTAVVNGTNADITVEIDTAGATETLYAMLHTDGGELGAWEFPNGPDTPVAVDGQVVTPAFMANLQAAASQTAPSAMPTAEAGAAADFPAGAVVVTGDEAEVEIEDFQFRPKVLVISLGTTVKFANKDDVQHTATSDTGIFDSGYLSKGEEFSFTFAEPGTYPYYCIPHGGPGGVGMAATIIVQP